MVELSMLEILLKAVDWVFPVAAACGALAGGLHARRLQHRQPGVAFSQIHLYTRWPEVIALTCLVPILLAVWQMRQSQWIWRLPLWCDALIPLLSWGGMIFSVVYLLAFALAILHGSRHIKRNYLSVVFVGLLLIFFAARQRIIRPIYGDLEDTVRTEFVLQSTRSTCVPATAANILDSFGESYSERELAKLMKTTRFGSSDSSFAAVLGQLGFSCRRVYVESIEDVQAPALLSVNTMDKHAIAFLSYSNNVVSLINPLSGPCTMTPEQLDKIWEGRAIEVQRISESGRNSNE